jgi:hypothetical protein
MRKEGTSTTAAANTSTITPLGEKLETEASEDQSIVDVSSLPAMKKMQSDAAYTL